FLDAAEIGERMDEGKQSEQRPDEQHQEADERHQRKQPSAGGAAVEQLRQQVRDADHDQAGDEGRLEHYLPFGTAFGQQRDAACIDGGEDNDGQAQQQEVLEHREGERALVGAEADAVFEFFLEEVQRREL